VSDIFCGFLSDPAMLKYANPLLFIFHIIMLL
jgi:hypothetical protein